MEPLVYQATYEVFLVLEGFRAGFIDLVGLLKPLSGGHTDHALGVDAYYRPGTDIALLGLRYDERDLTANRLAALVEFAQTCGVPLLDPGRLKADDRTAFYNRYLHEYPIRVEDLARPHQALVALGVKLGAAYRDPPDPLTELASPPSDPFLAVTDTSDAAVPPPPGNAQPAPPPVRTRPPAERAPTENLRRTTPGVIEPPPELRTALGSRPRAVEAVDTWRQRAILARFQRGGGWAPARLRSLGMKSAYLVTPAPPPVGDVVEVALALGQVGTVAQAKVVHVSTPEEAAESGAAGFFVHFPQEDSPARRQLATLLRLAHAHGIALKPPPPRRHVRYPVRWPVRVATSMQRLTVDATDVSAAGLYVVTGEPLDPGAVMFALPLDDGSGAVRGRARIARTMSSETAEQRGLEPGFGLEILELPPDDEDRYNDFLRRVGSRVPRRVLVVAAQDRCDELVGGLVAAGYAATGTDDLREVIDLAEQAPCAPDAALIDASFPMTPIAGRRLEHALAARDVPWVSTLHGETGGRARAAIDQLLAVC